MTRREHQVQGGILRVGGGGWADWIPAGEARGQVRLRTARDRQGRKVIAEVRIADPSGVAAGLLRQIPLGALEDVLNAPRVIERSARVGATAEIRVVEIEVVAAEYAAAAAVTRHPARKLAEDRGVSGRTVSRWLAEARRRGLLSPARRSPAR